MYARDEYEESFEDVQEPRRVAAYQPFFRTEFGAKKKKNLYADNPNVKIGGSSFIPNVVNFFQHLFPKIDTNAKFACKRDADCSVRFTCKDQTCVPGANSSVKSKFLCRTDNDCVPGYRCDRDNLCRKK
ncbi:hypothetical protein HDU91_003701 [Kappamyces sp. JEL0680]|nr:hypothetical protein HDU91_003701 [Kappamyces sp. JEL0680]